MILWKSGRVTELKIVLPREVLDVKNSAGQGPGQPTQTGPALSRWLDLETSGGLILFT